MRSGKLVSIQHLLVSKTSTIAALVTEHEDCDQDKDNFDVAKFIFG